MITSTIGIILLFSILIFVHEFGHFIVAKRNGVKVEKFAIGFGPKIISWKRQDTEYQISLIPFGGYVKLKGEDDFLQQKEKYEEWEYMGKSPGIRAKILFAGSLNNLIFGFLLLIPVFMIGVPTYDGTKIGEFLKGMPAESSGLKIGDEILEVNGEKCKDWMTVSMKIREFTSKNKEKPVEIKVKRNGKIRVFNIKPAPYIQEIDGKKEVVYIIGILPKEKIEKYPFHKAILRAAIEFYYICEKIIEGFKLLFTGKLSLRFFAGPVGIAELGVKVLKVSIVGFIQLMALLSINLGILNLFPFPVLDGGHIVGVFIEKIRKKRPDPKLLHIVQNISITLLILFAIYITYNDIFRVTKNLIKK